jgi:hypothetical protein
MKAVRYWIGVSKKKKISVRMLFAISWLTMQWHQHLMVKSVYHGVGIQIDDIKYLFSKALESKQIIENMLGEKRKGLYDISEMVQVNKKVRTHNESE